MSFLNSVMASIDGGQNPAPAQSARPAVKPTPTPKALGLSNGTRPILTGTSAPPKRKADGLDPRSVGKAVKLEAGRALAPPPSRSATSSPALKLGQAASKSAIPYRGTGFPSTQSPAPLVSKPSPAATSAAPIKPAAPKTGYLAVLERAKAAQEAAKQAGGIKHVKKEKMSRRERERLQAEANTSRSSTPVGRSSKQQGPSRSKSSEPLDTKRANGVKKERTPVEVGYKGTMRPVSTQPPAYRGTMHGGSAPAARPGQSVKRQAVQYSDEEEDDEDDEEDYDSASDMEAGRDDIDEEEEMSARLARQEDLEAIREENELKRQKLERKRKLEKLQAAAAAKKPRY